MCDVMSNTTPPAKRQRLGTADCEWNYKILAHGQYRHTVLPDEEIPFVNRYNEVYDLLLVNADALIELLRCREQKQTNISTWRPFHVAVAAQMFGNGKTALGRNFIRQLSDTGFETFAKEKIAFLANEAFGKALVQEWELAKGAEYTRYDLSGCATLKAVADLLKCDKHGHVAVHIAEHICSLAENGPRFVHFDEVGDLGQEIAQLREAIRQTWIKILTSPEAQMPRIHFYISGKSVPLAAIGGPSSPVGTKWIILDLLKEIMI